MFLSRCQTRYGGREVGEFLGMPVTVKNKTKIKQTNTSGKITAGTSYV